MWLINIIVIKLEITLMLIITLKKKSIFNTQKLVYGYFLFLWQWEKIVYFTSFNKMHNIFQVTILFNDKIVTRL
jgi:hypothetical protein